MKTTDLWTFGLALLLLIAPSDAWASSDNDCKFPAKGTFEWLVIDPGVPPESFTSTIVLLPMAPDTRVRCPKCQQDQRCDIPCQSVKYYRFEAFPRTSAKPEAQEIWAAIKSIDGLSGARLKAVIEVVGKPESVKPWVGNSLEASSRFDLEITCYEVVSRGDK
jgi:hypothetical protein